MTLEVRRGTMNGATVAVLGMLAALAGLMKLLDLPGGGSGLFFLVVLAGAAFGPRFGLLLVDEPFVGLDQPGKLVLLELLEEVASDGAATVVAHPEGEVHVITTGDARLATAGTGFLAKVPPPCGGQGDWGTCKQSGINCVKDVLEVGKVMSCK